MLVLQMRRFLSSIFDSDHEWNTEFDENVGCPFVPRRECDIGRIMLKRVGSLGSISPGDLHSKTIFVDG
jgi:hypothetical protein